MDGKKLYQGAKNNDILHMNCALILQIIRKKGICSRVELAKSTGLTQASITKLIASLIEQEIVHETGILDYNERGRKSIGLCLNEELGKVVSVNISRTFIKVSVHDINGKVLHCIVIQLSQFASLEAAMNHIVSIINEYTIAFTHIKAIGLALPGPYLRNKQTIAVSENNYEWFKFHPQAILEKHFKLPVFPIHDADAAALGSWWEDDTLLPNQTLVYMLLGEGVGAGLILNGKLFEGSFGTAAEIGHMSININGPRCSCGNRGCLEQYCSTNAIIEKAKKDLPSHPESGLSQYTKLTFYDIFNEYDKFDPYAVSLVRDACEHAGFGVINLIHAYNPDVIILGNLLTRARRDLLSSVKSVVDDRVIPEIADQVQIRLESPGTDSILYGCAMHTIDHLINQALRK